MTPTGPFIGLTVHWGVPHSQGLSQRSCMGYTDKSISIYQEKYSCGTQPLIPRFMVSLPASEREVYCYIIKANILSISRLTCKCMIPVCIIQYVIQASIQYK